MLHYINSDTRTEGTASNFKHGINIQSGHNRVSLVSISFPKTFYIVTDGANTFSFNGIEYEVPPGNYSVEEFATTVSALVPSFDMVFSQTTGKFTITAAGTPLAFSTSSNLHKLFGFSRGSSTLVQSTIVSPNVVDFQGLSEVFVNSDISRDSSKHNSASLLNTFYVNSEPYNSAVVWYNPQIDHTSKPLSFHTEHSTGMIHMETRFTILDQDMNEIDLNGLNFSMVLRTWREENTESLIRDYIQMQSHKLLLKHMKEQKSKNNNIGSK